MSFGWSGKLVRLVPLDKARHIENAMRWFNDPEVTRWLLMGDFPLTRLAEESWFNDRSQPTHNNPNPAEIAFAVETLAGRHIGFCGIHRIDYRHGVGTTGTIIGPAEYRGRGFGSDAVAVRTRYAFEVAGLRLLLSEVMAGNDASVIALKRAGYREVGCLPKRTWKRGAYRDVILLALERDKWRDTETTPTRAESQLPARRKHAAQTGRKRK